MELVSDKPRKRRKKSLIVRVAKEFTSNTSLHGMKYLSESEFSVFEKMFWLGTFVLSLAMCCTLIYNVWTKWQTRPVIVSFSEKLLPVWQVPFPSVTICPQVKSRASIYNYTSNMKKYLDQYILKKDNLTSTFTEKLENIALVCELNNAFEFTGRKTCNHSIVDDINEVSPDIDDIFETCFWRGKMKSCDELFSRVITSKGICFTFNGLTASEIFHEDRIQNEYLYLHTTNKTNGWSLANGYTMKVATEEYPRRGRENGAKPDLDIILLENRTDVDGICNGINTGFKIHLHHPADAPRSKMYYYGVPRDQTTSLAVSFRMITTSDTLKNYDTHIRQCYFSTERQLRYYKEYTQSNCEAECRSNYTFAKCGCVWFNMPHNNSEELCCHNKHMCVYEAKEELADYEMKLAQEAASGNVTDTGCRCLPACNYLHYDAEVLKSDFDLNTYSQFFQNIFNLSEEETHHYSRLLVYFKDAQYVSIKRSELFGLTDFLANCGGLLGLFLGFSFLSLVEIAYFSSFRICCIIRRDYINKAKNKTNVEVLSNNDK